jgi:hypothetical protein
MEIYINNTMEAVSGYEIEFISFYFTDAQITERLVNGFPIFDGDMTSTIDWDKNSVASTVDMNDDF